MIAPFDIESTTGLAEFIFTKEGAGPSGIWRSAPHFGHLLLFVVKIFLGPEYAQPKQLIPDKSTLQFGQTPDGFPPTSYPQFTHVYNSTGLTLPLAE